MDSVKVALRIRPLVNSEIELGCRRCVERIPKEPQVTIGKSNQMFTYNYVFDEEEGQGKVYDLAVKPLIDNLFKGYNVTILAYGQTGSGKTFTMGTNYSGEGELGVIPRAIYDIFQRIEQYNDKEFQVQVSFIELYNEYLYDLLTERPREQSIVDMREYGSGVCIPGLSELGVDSPAATLARLREGSAGRVVGATAMNAQSSRSHAIFTVNIKITPKENPTEAMTSKFHLVDLAGSERSKKTGASGDRFREGVNINKGLLSLGNVISQLGEGNHGFINYRDSKLTRLLQDSLGGNSVTLMIACISPADYNQDETLSTLRYADRARKIKNRPIVNQDPQLAELIKLRKENDELKLRMISEGRAFECPPEHKVMKMQLSDAQKKINQLSKALSDALIHNTNMYEKALSIENAETTLKEKLTELVSFSETIPEDDPRWKPLKEMLLQVRDEQAKVEQEILSFDKSVEHQVEDKEEDDENEDEGQDGVITKCREEHITSQAKIKKEFFQLTKNLMWKEELVAKLAENNGQLGQMQGVSQQSIDELKKQLAEVEQEKEELLRQIRLQSNTQNNSAKLAETRRKRLQELEAKVSSLMKKVTEQERVIKMKEKSDEKIMALKQEIMSMKQMKVRLIQQMKSENDKFKALKAEKDKEVCQLKNQNMKRQNQLKKIEMMYIMQQNVLRRKLEAAAAANKRIMAALERQKAARDKRTKGPVNMKIKERFTEELELVESEYQAQKSLENLLQDRAALTQEKAVILESLEDSSVTEEEKAKLKMDLKQVEQDLELRSAEISDLQQKLLDVRNDDRIRQNWDMLQSMADAKFALTYLFNLVSEKVKEKLDSENVLSELKEQLAETDVQLSEYQGKLMNLESYHKIALERMEKECEEKVYIFMKLASENAKAGPVSETLKARLEELEKLDQLRQRIKELEEENARLMSSKSELNTTTTVTDPFKKFLEERMNGTFVLPEKKKEKPRKPRETFALADEESLKAFDTSTEIDDDDPDNDPDWRKTPIYKKLHALKRTNLGKRRSQNNEKCECTGNCEKDCLCVKSSSPCNENCQCDRSMCVSSRKRTKVRLTQRADFNSDDKIKVVFCDN